MTRSFQNLDLEPSWSARLEGEFSKPYMSQLSDFLHAEKLAKKEIYPRETEYFFALNKTPFENVKVVILGQDPYHGPGQAHGLSFSVPPGVPIPPSLKNIYKELQFDIGAPAPVHGYLESWAKQGVLLLNATLSVESGKAGSHQKQGWEQFTDAVIDHLNREKEHLVFVLWGAYAQKKCAVIDRKRHLVLESVHPSPLSSHRGFFGSRPFSKINKYLKLYDITPIDWALPDSPQH